MRDHRLTAGVFLLTAAYSAAASPTDFFESKIRPVLAANCYSCHTTAAMGGLRVDSRDALLKGGKSGPALQAGAPESSLLIKAIRHEHEKLRMPPSGGKLKDTEIADLTAWIRDGAVWPTSTAPPSQTAAVTQKFWSLEPVPQPRNPAATLDTYITNTAKPAARRTLIRRVTYSLTGLPPAPAEVDAFLADKSPNAYEKLVDRLLASPRYGERWARLWLDVARYADDRLTGDREEPRENAHFYRDWVIRAFNDDLPYDQFVKAQIAGDLLGKPEWIPALGFYGLSPEFQDDRVDVTTRGFLAFTAACAQCHDHKFDPIPTRDFYALQGVFSNTEPHEEPLAPKESVERWDASKKELDAREEQLKTFLDQQANSLAAILAHQAASYLEGARGGSAAGLDPELLEKWKKYIAKELQHPYLKLETQPGEFQKLLLAVRKEHDDIEEENNIRLGGSTKRGDLSQANLKSLERDKYVLWRDFFGNSGVFYFADKKLDRWLSGPWKAHLDTLRAQVDEAKKALPAKYPFAYVIRDKPADKIKNLKVHIRGNPENLGDEAPRAFLSALCEGKPKPFAQGSGRRELAEAIGSKDNPLTARVIVNRIWAWQFGEGIVKTQSNFGRLGEKPTNPELLDYLAWRLTNNGWSIKKLQREIVLSRAYRAERTEKHRLDVESLRDSILSVAGTLDPAIGGPAQPLDDKNKRRTIYAWVSRRRPDRLLGLFDFPNATATSEQRVTTNVPLQRLFLLNSATVMDAAEAIAKKTESTGNRRIDEIYRLLFQRPPDARERKLGAEYLARNGATAPAEYIQALLASDEFLYLN